MTFNDRLIENITKSLNDPAPAALKQPNGRGKKLKPGVKKESCWHCYKLFEPTAETNQWKDGAKSYCSSFCFRKYQAMNSMSCSLEGCNKTFLKSKGVYVHGKWFCCDEHAEKDPQTKELIAMMKKHESLGPMDIEAMEKEMIEANLKEAKEVAE